MSLAFRHRKNFIVEKIYQISPAWVHDLIFSGYGFLKRIEANKLYRSQVPALEKFEKQPVKYIAEEQNRKLLSILRYANKHSAYYRKQLYMIGIDLEAENIDPVTVLQELPILTKDDIISHYNDIVSDEAGTISNMPHSSGGTTGTTLNFLLDQGSYLAREAEVLSYWKRHGYIIAKDKSIMFRAGVLVPSGQEIKRPWRHDYGRNLLYLSSYYSSPDFFDAYIEKLKNWKPQYMHALPSAVYLFASYLLEKKEVIPLKKIFSASEMLYPMQKKVLEQAFQCEVVDHYGHCEPGNYAAGQCRHGRYHINPNNVYTELTQNGDILETSLNNYSMPFLRYKVGDKASKLVETGCECGLNTPYFESIEGRDSEVIHTADGRIMSSIGFDQIFRSNNVVLGQIIQEIKGEIILKVVPMKSFTSDSEKKILGALRDRVGIDTHINLVKVSDIASSKSGKYRMIISKVKN